MSTAFPGLTAAELDARGASWTAREIAQQPAVWPQIGRMIESERARLDALLAPLLREPTLRIVLTGAGTSGFIGDCLAPAMSARMRRRVDAIATTSLVSGPDRWLADDAPTLLVSFSRSGNSPESVAAIELAEQALDRVHHLIVTCNAAGALAVRGRQLPNAALLLLPEVTNDRGFAMTLSFSSMLLSAALTFGLIRPQSIARLAQAAETILQEGWLVTQRWAARNFERVVYLGSNELRGLAAEAALKLLELTDGRVVAVADSPLAFRHGPKTVVNDRTLVVVMLSNERYTRAYDRDLLRELRRDARAGAVVALGAHADDMAGGDYLHFADASDASDLEMALLHVVVAQSYALLQSMAVGLTPDRPNKAGTVHRVVQGVVIHPWQGNRDDVPGR